MTSLPKDNEMISLSSPQNSLNQRIDSSEQQSYIVRITTYPIVFLLGALIVIQSGINVTLGDALGNGIRGAFASFIVSFLLIIPFIFNGPSLDELKRNAVNLKVRMLLGGFLGGTYVIASIFIPPVIGFAFFFLLVVCGQLGTSMALDHYGLGVTKRPVTYTKAFGLVITITGICILRFVNTDPGFNDTGASDVLFGFFILLSLISGILLPIQSVLNKELTCNVLGTVYRSTFVSLAASIFLGVIPFVLSFVFLPWEFSWEPGWMWLGGLIGVVFVACATYFPQFIGVAPFFVTIICGQLFCALLLDHFGAFHFDKVSLNWSRISGVAIAVTGAALVLPSESPLVMGYNRIKQLLRQ